MYLINNIGVRKFISDTLLYSQQEMWFCCYECTYFYYVCTIQSRQYTNAIVGKTRYNLKLRIFELGYREIAAGGELLCNIVTTDSVVAAY